MAEITNTNLLAHMAPVVYMKGNFCKRQNKQTKTTHRHTSAYSGSWMKPAQLTRSSNKRTEIAHTLHRPLRKGTPRSSPLFIYSRCSPADIPPTLLRRPRNKHTGQGGGSLGRSEVVDRGSAIAKHQTYVPETETKQHFCAVPELFKLRCTFLAHSRNARHAWNGKHDIEARSVMSSWEDLKVYAWPYVQVNRLEREKKKPFILVNLVL